MNYQTFDPHQELKMVIKCYWTMEDSAGDRLEKQSIIPDGCMEMIFHHGDLYKQYTGDGNSMIQPRCFVIGQLTRPLEIEPTGKTSIFSVRFHPHGFLPFASIPIKEMENTAIPLEKLFGRDGKDIEEKIFNAHSVQERINLVEIFLLDRLASLETIDHIVRSTVETILTGNGQLSIDELSSKIDINRRQMERKFYLAIGLRPKQLSKIIRLQAALKMLLTKESANLTSLAHANDYYDQSHFIKDFRELVGITPKEFYRKNLKMSSFFIGD
ncbi:helix-turn-helix domain-containing protein [Chryseobacterium fluminis]|uniref:helix-turn-helix domain-containing protein n=1 Tax=Chryseobacterium fluminis TaxID=2983606 RepID=UPI002B1CD2AB|nr:helix-turn-helix domain-containing protein [Chryseobacterium sp. MMS21-Ot14]